MNLAPILVNAIKESPLPLQVIFNAKVEKIRFTEYENKHFPQPIRFDISDSYTGEPHKKLIKIWSVSAPKESVFEIDLTKNERSLETINEKFNRDLRKKSKKPIIITDYTKGARDNAAVGIFVKDLHDRVLMQTQAQYLIKKKERPEKTDKQKQDKFSKQLVGMRRGKQYEFTKIEKPELEDRKKAKKKEGGNQD